MFFNSASNFHHYFVIAAIIHETQIIETFPPELNAFANSVIFMLIKVMQIKLPPSTDPDSNWDSLSGEELEWTRTF